MATLRRKFGNAMPEYTVIAILTGIITVGGMMALSMDFGGSLEALRDDLQGNTKAALVASTASTPPPSDNVADSSKNNPVEDPASQEKPGQTLIPPGEPICTQTNVCIDGNLLDIVTRDNIVETVGANGGEVTLLTNQVLWSLADQLKLDPNVDQSVVDALTKLAQLGHQLAAVEDDTWQITQEYPCQTNCNNAEAKAILQPAFQQAIDARAAYQTQRDVFLKAMYADWGDMQGPTADLIKKLAQNSIDYGNKSYEYAYARYMATIPSSGPEHLQNMKDLEPHASVADLVTHNDSNKICQQGDDPSQCTQ